MLVLGIWQNMDLNGLLHDVIDCLTNNDDD